MTGPRAGRLNVHHAFIPQVGPPIWVMSADELIILPLGVWLVLPLIPREIMVEYRAKASEAGKRPISRAGMAAIILLWTIGVLSLGWISYAYWCRP